MSNTLVTLDFYNDNFFIQAGDFNHLWANRGNFLNTGFPFSDTVGLLSYEPLRNFYAVEYIGGESAQGRSEEITWIEENFDRLLEHAREEKELLDNPVISIRDMREIKLHETQWMVQRHQEQILANNPTSLTELQFDGLLAYRQWLRDITVTYPDIDLDGPSTSITWATLDLSLEEEQG